MRYQAHFENYSPVGDLMVVSICLVMIVLIRCSYIRKSRAFRIFLCIVGLLIGSAYCDVGYHTLAVIPGEVEHVFAVVLRCAFHSMLFMILLLFIVYIGETVRLERRERLMYLIPACAIFGTVMTVEVVDSVRGVAIVFGEDAIGSDGHNIFPFGYVAFVTLISVMMVRYRGRIYRRVMAGFYGTMAISFLILMVQGIHGQSSFTVATYLYPAFAMFYTLHSNPFDPELGTIEGHALSDIVREYYLHRRDFIFLSLYLRDFDEEGKVLPDAIRATARQFVASYFRGALLFQIGRGHQMLVALKRRNPDYERRLTRILDAFNAEYPKYKYDYKLVFGESIHEISQKNEYVSFIRSIHAGMQQNTVHRVGPEDIKRFNRYEHIMHSLDDICKKRDLDDPRVLAYCQPVFNLKTQKYDTAEALMRLQLDELGMVFPDEFIPLAEENGQIHVLTEIILHKTCVMIHKLTEAGYTVTRISVNVSVPELKDEKFCDDILGIIRSSGIADDKIAIELTESQNESDFLLMKSKISELKLQGIKFYLDDFGTGYSNMERIMELPFDIIKFDRSMVLASGANDRSYRIVSNLAAMFSDLNYCVLYEGVEKDSDETMCESMSASYLQGYKYSRPVPIETLDKYFEK